ESAGPLGYLLYPNPEMTVALLVLMPLSVLLSIEVCVLISARVTDVRAAQQAAGLLTVPFVLVYVAGLVTLGLNAEVLLLLSGILVPLVVGLYFVSLRTFRRDEILTRWK
ncbi:MAG TPA: ABC transporter permease, partial [Thermoplasmata archaeon]|nr:ABC transporter permease [Thermoplasmata archaeon]